jgi:hypothetical protein
MLRHHTTQLYHEQYFNELLALERRKCERSKVQALLMLADLSDFHDIHERLKIAKLMREVLSNVTRETDVKGWYSDNAVMGVLFTEMGGKEAALPSTPWHIANKCLERLNSHLGPEMFSCIEITWRVLPEEFPARSTDPRPKPSAIGRESTERRVSSVAKRLMQVIGGIFAMVLLSLVE